MSSFCSHCKIMSRDTIFFCSKDARLPVQLQRAMAAEAEAAREARAKATITLFSTVVSFLESLPFRLLLQRANKKPPERSKRPPRSFPNRRRPSNSATCRYVLFFLKRDTSNSERVCCFYPGAEEVEKHTISLVLNVIKKKAGDLWSAP